MQSIFRISDIISLGRSFFLLGLIAVAIFIVIYLLLYKKWTKKQKKGSKGRLLVIMLFIFYMVIMVGATVLSRGGYYEGMIHGLFASYQDAWYKFDPIAWRNLILNIAMFVPVGFLLPLGWISCRRFWKTYAIGFFLTIVIEFVQYAAGRGVFEADDILNNTIGTMIGFGLAKLVLLATKEKANRRLYYLTLQLPLICTILFFAGIFGIYSQKEMGNLLAAQNMHYKNVSAYWDGKTQSTEDIQPEDFLSNGSSSKPTLSEQEKEVPVYIVNKASLAQTRTFADTFFANLNTSVEESRIDVYENTVIYWSADDRYSLWITYMGLAYDMTDFSLLNTDPALGCHRAEIEQALAKWDIQIPAQADFSEEENGYYRFYLSQHVTEDGMWDGSLHCRYTSDGRIETINNQLLWYDTYKNVSIISEKDAFEKIQVGAFYCYQNCDNGELILSSCELDYQTDSKGYYRPVYVFTGTLNGDGIQIELPAEK